MNAVGVVRDGQCRIDDYRIVRALARAGAEPRELISEELVLPADRKAVRSSIGEVGALLVRLQSGKTRYFLTRVAEASGYRVINASPVQAYSRDKFLTYLAMGSSGVPTPAASFPLYAQQVLGGGKRGLRRELFGRLAETAEKMVGGIPCVEKPVDGSHGRKVRMLRTDGELREAMGERSAMDPTILQPFYDSPFEIRAVSIKYPGSGPEHLASIAKCAIERGQAVRNLAVTGVPVLVGRHKLVEKLEIAAMNVLAPGTADYAVTGNDWTPAKVPESEGEKVRASARKLLPLFQRLKASRERLAKLYRRLHGSAAFRTSQEQLEEAEAAHERVALEFLNAREHRAAESVISAWLDESSELLLLDVNDNQDFPNVRDLTQRRVEDDYASMALAVSSLPPPK
ncbi:MAG: hypothetical protein JTT11_07080 [Candidatus Brockarchaeota archaeon]|nr:hypothetical protein [Candidatus Brockarchaeota archaeon]